MSTLTEPTRSRRRVRAAVFTAGVVAVLGLGTASAPPAEAAPRQQAPAADARSTADGIEPGAVAERVVSLADPSKSYAVYLPGTYREDRTWPVLILMDPRGRALLPLELFRVVAEELGWIVVSSYDTLSDTTWEPNELAVRAIVADIPQRFAADARRVYLAGMSGTARGIWSFADRLQPYVAGVIAFAGGKHDWVELPTDPEYAFFGATGYVDFNFGEMFALDDELDGLGVVHRVVYFPGGHEWGTPEVCREAARWLEMRAMAAGLRATEPGLVAEWIEDELANAAALERERRPWNAWRSYRAIAADYAALANPEQLRAAAARAEALATAGPALDAERRVRRYVQEETEFRRRLIDFFDAFSRDPTGVDAQTARWRLGLERIGAQRDDATDHVDAEAAQRLLESAFVQMSFYLPREFADRGRFEQALGVLDIAEEIKPAHPTVAHSRALTYLRQGRPDDAIAALERGAEVGALGPRHADGLEGDEALAALRGHPRFRALLERLRGSG